MRFVGVTGFESSKSLLHYGCLFDTYRGFIYSLWKFQTLQDSEKRSQYDQVATPKLLEKYSIASAACAIFFLLIGFFFC